jgi:cytochrome c oxidase subunit I+III
LPLWSRSVAAAFAWLASAGAIWFADRALGSGTRNIFAIALMASLACLWVAFGFSLDALLATNLRPQSHGFASTAFTIVAWQGLHAVLLTFMGGFTLARFWAGMIDSARRTVFDNTRIFWYYSAAQGVIALLILHTPMFGA